MRINRVRIRNFRCLEDVNLQFDDVTTLIGPNGAGKSTVLRALDWFFNGPKVSELGDDDCTFGNQGARLSVEVEFGSLTADDRAELGKYVTVDSDRCVIWKYRDSDGSEIMTGNARTYPSFDPIRRAPNATEMKRIYQELRSRDASLGLASWTSKAICEQTLKTWELENVDKLEDSTVTVTNLFGFAGQAVMSGRFDFVFVSADMRASEESKDARTALIGRILERTVDRSAADEDIESLAKEVEEKQAEIYDRNFKQQLVDLSGALSDAVGQYTIGRTVKVQAHKQEIKPPRTQFGVSIIDAAMDTPVEKQGHGFQRTLLVSALQLLAERGVTSNGNGAICLAVEEPELYQHPVQARSFSSVLRRLAEDQNQNIQVAYATHSPYFIDAGKFHQVRRVTRAAWSEEGKAPEVTVCSSSIADVERRLAGYGNSVRSQLDSVAASKLPEALFSNAAVLVEGTTDKVVLEGCAERSLATSLLSRGITVADVGGKSGLLLTHAILSELGIPCYVIFDGDKGSAARMVANGSPQKKIDAQVENDKRDNRKLLKYLGESEVDFPVTGVHDRHAIIEDTLETLLESEWPDWVSEKDAIIASGLGSPKKSALVYFFAAKCAGSAPPSFIMNTLAKIHMLTV